MTRSRRPRLLCSTGRTRWQPQSGELPRLATTKSAIVPSGRLPGRPITSRSPLCAWSAPTPISSSSSAQPLELQQELPELESRAAKVSHAENLPAPGGGPEELVDWASQARAELLVAAGQVSAQRERVVREGNELASMLLAEPTYGLTVAQALRHVEAGQDESARSARSET